MKNIFARLWKRRAVRWVCYTLAFAVAAILAVGGYTAYKLSEHPAVPFDSRTAPPAPDYSRADAWLAFPGRDGLERSVPPGLAAVNEAQAPADVFFIPPTTFLKNDVWNAPYNVSDEQAPLNPAVLLAQLSVYNGCCRLYAPRYRQATLAALGRSRPAVAFAYADVARAFRYYIAHENHGRPFIIASHSQGSMHAVRLLQAEILGTPLRARLVVAYVIGGYAPVDFGAVGLPVCDGPRQTGCIISWNTGQAGRSAARMVIDNKVYWWRGAERTTNQPPAICVNPLDWRQDGAAPASANPGSLPFPQQPFAHAATILPALAPHLTGASCHQGMLEVDVPSSAPPGFHDMLSVLLGSYHLNDYGIFYAALRTNAIDRVAAWRAAHP